MAGIKVGFPFTRTSSAPIDESFVLTKAQMRAVNDSHMPEKYFTVCADDGKLYIYDKSVEKDETTGRYREYKEGGDEPNILVSSKSSIAPLRYDLIGVPTAQIATELGITETEVDDLAARKYTHFKVGDKLYPVIPINNGGTYGSSNAVMVFSPGNLRVGSEVEFFGGFTLKKRGGYNMAMLRNSLEDAESTANKVSAWQETPDDTHYPSEALVKSELDRRQLIFGPGNYDPANIPGAKEGDIYLHKSWQEIQVERPMTQGGEVALPKAKAYEITANIDTGGGASVLIEDMYELQVFYSARGPVPPPETQHIPVGIGTNMLEIPQPQEYGVSVNQIVLVCTDPYGAAMLTEFRVSVEELRPYEYINGSWKIRQYFSGKYSDLSGKPDIEGMIDQKLADFDKLDYEVADSAPTATKVVIKGEEVDVIEGVRYLVEIPGENKFEEYVVLDGTVYDLGNATGSGSTDLEADLVVTNPIGKYAKDDEIPKGTTLESIIRGMLSKTYYPTLTPPSASISFSIPALAKVGQEIASGEATVSFNRGSINPKYTAESQHRAGNATDFAVSLAGASVQFSDNNDNGTFTVPEFTRDSKGTVTLNATVTHEAGPQPKDSDGNNYQSPLSAGNVTASKGCEFILPFYWGKSASPAIADLSGLTEDLRKKENRTYSYDTVNEHMVFAYDAAYGNLRSILDQNNFETIGGWIVSEITVDGQRYKVYVAELATTDTGADYIFKF